MLSKLIKHEFRATRRIMLPLLAAIVALSVMSGIAIRLLDKPNTMLITTILSFVVIIAYFAGMFAAAVVAFVLMIQRFRRNLLGAEGYLMFTLPVSVDTQILAKVIVSMVWFAAAGLMLFTTIIMIAIVDSSMLPNIALGFKKIAPEIVYVLEYIGNGSMGVGIAHLAGYCLELILSMLLSSATLCLRFYMAMAVGYSFSNHKKLFSVLTFFGVGALLSILGSGLLQILGAAGDRGLLEWLNALIENSMSSVTGATFAAHIALDASIVFELVMSVIFYLPTRYFLKNKLNLA